MQNAEGPGRTRKRAPSRRSLATRKRILDAAEAVFAARGHDGATIRDIAAAAGEPVGSVHHHGGGKEELFRQTVARRAEALSAARLNALEQAREEGPLTLDSLLAAFMRPFFVLSREEPRWRDYARLVAHVSTDNRWQALTRDYFDPTARIFLAEIAGLCPGLSRSQVAQGFVFSVSAMLGLLTSQRRIDTLGGGGAAEDDQIGQLIGFCAAGFSVQPPRAASAQAETGDAWRAHSRL